MSVRSFALAALCALGLAPGCIFRTVAEQQRRIDASCKIVGRVSTEGRAEHPIVVGLVVEPGAPRAALIDHFVLERPGEFVFVTRAGTYGLGAFESVDGDLAYDEGEPGLPVSPDREIHCAEGETVAGIELVVPSDGRLEIEGPLGLAAVQVRSAADGA